MTRVVGGGGGGQNTYGGGLLPFDPSSGYDVTGSGAIHPGALPSPGGGPAPKNGVANSGGGAAGNAQGASGGSGVVDVFEPQVANNTSGRWTLQDVYQFEKDNNWF